MAQKDNRQLVELLSTYFLRRGEGGGGGVTDHGALTGLANDDHTQYLNNARHDTTTRHTLGTVVPQDSSKADDADVVKLTGNQTVAGIKTFSSFPVTPSSAPTSNYEVANKKYVDDNSGGGVKIIAVKSAVFTGTQSNSTAAGGNFAITDLSIAHACASTSNKIMLLGQGGVLGSSLQRGNVGLAFAAGGTLIGIGGAASNRTRVSDGAFIDAATTGNPYTSRAGFITSRHSPNSTASITYTLRAINIWTDTRIIYVNRTEGDADFAYSPRGASFLWVIEYED